MVESRSAACWPSSADEGGHDQRADQRADQRVVGHEQPGHGAGEGELARAVHGEGHGCG